MAEQELLNNIATQLNSIKKLLVVNIIDGKNQKDQISILSFAGFQPKEIAELLGTTSNTVSVMLNKLKKEKHK